MRASWSSATALLFAITLSASAQAPPLDEIVARLDAYLADYEPRLGELIADETMTQEVFDSTPATVNRDPDGVSIGRRFRRRLESEVAFVGLPDNAGWLGFRHVRMLDRVAVKDSTASLATSLSTQGYAAAQGLLMDSAKHNLGLRRTTNLPNLPLEFLHRRNRKRLVARLDAVERIRGVETTQVVFIERVTPSLIRSPFGMDMPSVVRAWIDRTGRLRRAEVRTFKVSSSLAASTMRVDFTEHKELGLLVPTEMHETFPVEPPATGTGLARYSNFRRFQTSARIVPPQEAR